MLFLKSMKKFDSVLAGQVILNFSLRIAFLSLSVFIVIHGFFGYCDYVVLQITRFIFPLTINSSIVLRV